MSAIMSSRKANDVPDVKEIPFQCGQMAALLKELIELKSDSQHFAEFSGDVSKWVAPLYANFDVAGFAYGKNPDKDREVLQGSEYIRLDSEVLYDPKVECTKLFNVGDTIIPTDGEKRQTWGHAATVVDKGLDSKGRTWIKIIDANYDGYGGFRSQIVWAENFAETVFPGKPRHIYVIRPEKIDAGKEDFTSDSDFLEKSFLAKVNETDVVLPSQKLIYDTSVGDKDSFKIVNVPGIAVSKFNQNGLETALNPSTLGNLPVLAGNSLKIFAHVFLKIKGYDTKEKTSIIPAKVALDGSDQKISNSQSLLLNMNDGNVSLDTALACGIDVPYSKVFKEALDNNPGLWSEFNNFLDFFGVNLVDLKGESIVDPTSLGPLGRDVWTDFEKLGYAVATVMNPEEMIGNDSLSPDFRGQLVSACNEVKDTLFDKGLRERLIIDDQLWVNHVSSDPTSPTVVNAVINPYDDPSKVSINTRVLGVSDTSVSLKMELDGTVNVTLATGQANDGSVGLINRKASSIATNGLPLVALEV